MNVSFTQATFVKGRWRRSGVSFRRALIAWQIFHEPSLGRQTWRAAIIVLDLIGEDMADEIADSIKRL